MLLVEPGKYPQTVEIDNSLEAMQELVGGYIEKLLCRMRVKLLLSATKKAD